jgi:hypothetical protein
LVEVGRLLSEATPLFNEGKLAGLVLMGTRDLGATSNKSYVVRAHCPHRGSVFAARSGQ